MDTTVAVAPIGFLSHDGTSTIKGLVWEPERTRGSRRVAPRGVIQIVHGMVEHVGLSLIHIFMGWGMEDSLETAGAMKARGWGAAARRTTYARYRFRRFDAAALVFGGALALLAAAAAWAACAQFRFYPTIGGLAPWWNYLPYALFACLPLAITAKEHLRWRA